MSPALSLYYHPLASYCWKVLIALYENETPFAPRLVDLGDEAQRNALLKLWPVGKFPVLHDEAAGRVVPESSIIIEYLDAHHPGRTPLIPADRDAALEVRLQDRFFDQQIHEAMQKHVVDKLRPDGQRDPLRRRAGPPSTRTGLRHAGGDAANGAPGRPATPSAWPTAPRRRRSTTRTWCIRSARTRGSPPI